MTQPTNTEPFIVKRWPMFELGRIVSTKGVLATCSAEFIKSCLCRHDTGDFGNVSPEDWKANFEAMSDGSRIHSAYPIDPAMPCAGHGDNCLWIITEADRSVTTFLLPDEY